MVPKILAAQQSSQTCEHRASSAPRGFTSLVIRRSHTTCSTVSHRPHTRLPRALKKESRPSHISQDAIPQSSCSTRSIALQLIIQDIILVVKRVFIRSIFILIIRFAAARIGRRATSSAIDPCDHWVHQPFYGATLIGNLLSCGCSRLLQPRLGFGNSTLDTCNLILIQLLSHCTANNCGAHRIEVRPECNSGVVAHQKSLVFVCILLCILDHLFHIFVGKPSFVCTERDRRGFLCCLIHGRDLQNAIRIDLERHINLRDTSRRHRYARQQ
mmetsp:Transcript_24259/g.55421  ORF Transcript_24259/g.55421 Transcript_24259/m.55421 type:complete len:271 (+) Transcript_24259:44-856(+)